MRLEELCALDLQYSGDFHLVLPYGNESGLGWGIGVGTATGDRLTGRAQWSNHPRRRGDGAMLPGVRGVITTDDGAEVMFELKGRTVFVQRDGERVGRQLLMVLLESEDDRYAWLNNTVCMAEGIIDDTVHLVVHLCTNEL